MKQVVITADSAADIPEEIAREYGIKIIPMHVITAYGEKDDGVQMTARDVFPYVEKTGEMPRTSAVSPGEYLDFFKGFADEGKAVVHLSFCSELSSTYRNARIASARLAEVYPLDTRSLGGGISLLAIKGCEMRDKGKTAEEIYSALSELVNKVSVSYLLNTTEFLRLSGRCSAAASFGAELFSVKPCAAVVDGRIEIVKKYIGKEKAVRLQYADEQLKSHKNIDYFSAFLYHSGVPEQELDNISALLRKAGFRRVITAMTGCMISIHSGRNALGIHFISS